jgi:putative intracellular protease/amidase
MRRIANYCLIIFFLLLALCQETKSQNEEPENVAILLFDGVQIIDYTIPYEVLSFNYNVFTVSEKVDTVTTWRGMNVIPSYSFQNSPKADIIIIPGGNTSQARKNETLINWIKEKSKSAKIVMSICNGAFILARACDLANLQVTTTSDLIDNLKEATPNSLIVRDKRYVDNGKIIMTAGFSSGIDGSLHIISREFSPTWASIIARRIEYDWKPDSEYAAGALADCNAYKIFKQYLLGKLNGEPKLYSGDRIKWESMTEIKTDVSLASLISSLNDFIIREEKWELKNSDTESGKTYWGFKGKDSVRWSGETIVTRGPQKNTFQVEIKISKVGE